MKTLQSILFTYIMTAALSAAMAQNPGDNIFSGIQIHTINIAFSQPYYWDSLTTYYAAGLEQYMAATVTVNGVAYDSVGVRLKGNSSYTHPNNKKSIRLAFDQYKSQKWDGEKGIHLNNCWEDPTFMREKIHLDLLRDAGIPGPRANYAQVSINDTAFAFYSMVEHVDKTFLTNHFANKTGDMFKAVDAFGGQDTLLSDFVWYGSDTSLYSLRYELKTDGSVTARPTLFAFIDSLNHTTTPATTLPTLIDMPALYRAMATDNLFANLDAYIGTGRNFYVYFQPTSNLMDWIIWDVGLSFGGLPSSGVSNVEGMSVTYVSDSTKRPLFGKILSTPALRKEYLMTLYGIDTTYFTQARLIPHIDSVANAIKTYVNADTRKMFTYAQFLSNISSDLTVGASRKPGLKSFLALRTASVLSQLTALGIIGGTDTSKTDPAITALSLPQVIEGINGTNVNRLPFVYSARLTGLTANATYRYTNQIVTSVDAATTSGAGNCIFINGSGNFTRTTSPSLATSGAYGSFTTDNTGAYAGWFISEPTGNARFVPGKYVFMRIALNDGASGTTVATRLSLTDSVRVVKLDTTTSDSTGTALWCVSAASPKDVVFLYDNTGGTGRPVTGSYVEGDGVDNTTANSYATFYANNVNGVAGAFGVVIPNALANGIRRIEQRSFANGGIRTAATDADGTWPSGVVTVNPFGGTNPLFLSGTDVALTTGVASATELPSSFGLSQNYPNPFNPTTRIQYTIGVASGQSAVAGRVTLAVYDVMGRQIALLVDETQGPGSYEVQFDAKGLASGMYIYRLVAGSFVQTRGMLLVK
jgi:hypothetical protein